MEAEKNDESYTKFLSVKEEPAEISLSSEAIDTMAIKDEFDSNFMSDTFVSFSPEPSPCFDEDKIFDATNTIDKVSNLIFPDNNHESAWKKFTDSIPYCYVQLERLSIFNLPRGIKVEPRDWCKYSSTYSDQPVNSVVSCKHEISDSKFDAFSKIQCIDPGIQRRCATFETSPVENLVREIKTETCQNEKSFQFKHDLMKEEKFIKRETLDEKNYDINEYSSTHANLFSCDICGRSFKRKCHLTNHIAGVHSIGKNFYCTLCPQKFKLRTYLEKHIKVHHENKGQFKCSLCPKEFGELHQFKNHVKMHENKRSYKCSLCPKIYNILARLEVHLAKHENEGRFKCNLCSKTFNEKRLLMNHLKSRKNECFNSRANTRCFKCTLCSSKFSKSSALEKHLKNHKNERFFKCSTCRKEFSDFCRFKEHVEGHKKEKSLKCPTCPKSYDSLYILREHMAKHENEGRYECNLCHATFNEKRLLIGHIKSSLKKNKCAKIKSYAVESKKSELPCEENVGASDDRGNHILFTCDYCGNRYNNKLCLIQHIAIHLNEKNFKCSLCPQQFNLACYLKSHLDVNHKDKGSFKCTLCPKKYGDLRLFEEHLAGHENQNSYKCSLCPNRYNTLYQLNTHLLSHKNERQHLECSVCRKLCNKMCLLKGHSMRKFEKRVVKVTLSYSCDYCKKIFNDKHILARHIAIHVNKKKFKCSLCSKRFILRSYLRQHIKHNHEDKGHFKCSLCPKKFTFIRSLNIHLAAHENKRSFKCSQCPKSYNAAYLLKMHVSKHENEGRFKCSSCPMTFNEKRLLESHLKTRANKGPFKCGLCLFEFCRSFDLKKHLENHDN